MYILNMKKSSCNELAKIIVVWAMLLIGLVPHTSGWFWSTTETPPWFANFGPAADGSTFTLHTKDNDTPPVIPTVMLPILGVFILIMLVACFCHYIAHGSGRSGYQHTSNTGGGLSGSEHVPFSTHSTWGGGYDTGGGGDSGGGGGGDNGWGGGGDTGGGGGGGGGDTGGGGGGGGDTGGGGSSSCD